MTQAGTDFERLVADFCKRHWGSEFVRTNHLVDGREMDVIVETPREMVIIECTIDRSKKKAEGDISKIRASRRSLIGDRTDKEVRGYFVTQGDATPEAHQIAKDNGSWISACSFPSFVNEFNCSSTYLIERHKRPFGSVRNPADDSTTFDRRQYVQVPFRDYENNTEITIEKIANDIRLERRKRLIVTGDFGVGKSMTYRELFFRLSEQYMAGENFRFPIYINLSDANFDETDDFVDVLERHAKWVGLRSERDKIVHAWTSDCCILILDGFDELIRSGFTRLTTSSKDIRYASSHIIRAAITESPKNTPILISGRQSYFQDFDEMKSCLHARDFSHASLQDLHEDEVRELYRKINPKSKKPIIMGWLPQRALLLSYIYFELGASLSSDESLQNPITPGDGWNLLLDRLCSRETRVAKGAEPRQIRRLLERIALFARTNISDVGRVTSLHVADAYRDVMLMEPDISVQQVLMRFPGLTAGHANEERGFIDDAIYEAAQAGTIVEAIEVLSSKSPEYLNTEPVAALLKPLSGSNPGISILTAQVIVSNLRQTNKTGLLGVAIEQANDTAILSTGSLLADLLVCASLDPEQFLRKTSKTIDIRSADIREIDLTPELLADHGLRFHDCIFHTLDISINADLVKNIEFNRCRVNELNCSLEIEPELQRIGLLPEHIERKSIVDATNADILAMSIPDYFKALKIILRKLFRQPGSGRKKMAFHRGVNGLDGGLIDECLYTLYRHNIVYVSGSPQSVASIWHPNRAHSKRVAYIIDSITPPDDVVISELR